MRIDAGFDVGERLLTRAGETAAAAEAIGFDGMWSNETKHDAFLPLAIAAEHTNSLQIGTSVAIAFSRSPMVIAQLAWDLQQYSSGRFILGLGTQVKGHIERRFGMEWSAPAPRLKEYIAALRAIWHAFQTGERLDFHGEHYRHTLLIPFFNPGPIDHPAIPVHIAGVNPPLARVAGEVCDGFHVHPFHTARYVREVIRPALATGAARAGRPIDEITVSAAVFVVTGATPGEIERSREAARQQIAFYASTPTYRGVLDLHGWSDTGEQLSRLAAAREWDAMTALITDEMLSAFAVEGPTGEIGTELVARYGHLCDRVTLYRPFRQGQDDAFWRSVVEVVHAG